MTGWWMFGCFAGFALSAVCIVAAGLWWPVDIPEGRSVADIRWRLAWEERQSRMEYAMWPAGFPHDAPERPMGLVEAHRTMQRHRGCRVDECARKAAAWEVLVAAGRIKPDSGRSK
ncbi:hypothetical protein [Nocardia cyriacigeorgica]|uniref:Uncharacterized protein n=1 Tax=Nocardia cyriacigeorgica TaxID=135487 RepID=A0A5R8P062_9NOCA|nr:hypothetical protein [Nocardia cyriacigeorgica]TLF82570.1 hypothetical protein FEK34_02210 [Nocardia cyriacigeorgica]